jgi:VWFA-related protein
MSAGLLVSALALLAQAPGAATFPTSLETVYVDAFVARGSAPVTGLTADDFELLDDGVRQKVRLIDRRLAGIDAVLVLDVSSSMEGRQLEHLRAAARAFIRGLGPHDRAALLAFSERLTLLVGLTADRVRLEAALERLEARGATSLHDALYAALRLHEPGSQRPFVVAFSDGGDNTSWLRAEQVLRAAETSPAVVYAVGLQVAEFAPLLPGSRTRRDPRPAPNLQFLHRLAEASGGRFWVAEQSARLEEAFLRILGETRDRYLLAYEPAAPPRPGYHKLKLRLRGAGSGDVRARQGYRVMPFTPAPPPG